MAERSERVEGEEILDDYEDGEMEVGKGDDDSDHGRDGDAKSGGGESLGGTSDVREGRATRRDRSRYIAGGERSGRHGGGDGRGRGGRGGGNAAE